MNLKNFLAFALISALTFSCTKQPEHPISDDQQSQHSVSYGIISDAHGEAVKTAYFADQFKQAGVEGIILAGDLANNEPLRSQQPDTVPDKDEIASVITAAAQTNLPVYVIPGNHERRPDYDAAMRESQKKYPKVVDMAVTRTIDTQDVDFVSLPGYQTKSIPGHQFIPDDGYFASPEDILALTKLRKSLANSGEPVVLITHACGKTRGTSEAGPATIYNGNDVGDELTTRVMQQTTISFAVCGHIHEAGGKAAAFDGTAVQSGEWAANFQANFGTLQEWRYLDGQLHQGTAGILAVKGKKAKFEMLEYQK